MFNAAARISAGLIALLAWTGLIVQFAVLFRVNGSIGTTVSTLLAYFTIITNLLVAALFTAIVGGWRIVNATWALAGAALSILLVGVVYALLLSGLYQLTGGAAFSNVLMHQLTPMLVPLFWLIFVPKGGLSFRDPLLWAVYPLVYFIYALVRGQISGFYPYPFLDVRHLGWARAGLNAVLIAFGFLIVGWAMTLLDRRLGRASRV